MNSIIFYNKGANDLIISLDLQLKLLLVKIPPNQNTNISNQDPTKSDLTVTELTELLANEMHGFLYSPR